MLCPLRYWFDSRMEQKLYGFFLNYSTSADSEKKTDYILRIDITFVQKV